MRVNVREGCRRVCVVLSTLIGLCVLLIAWSSFPYTKSFWYYPENKPAYGDPNYRSYNALEELMRRAFKKGLITELDGRMTLDRALRTGDYSMPKVDKVVVSLWGRINWRGLFDGFLLSAMAIGFPWLLYGIGLYVARGFGKKREV